VLRLFADKFSESGTAEVQRIRFLVSAGVGSVSCIGAESFPPERFALSRECGNKSPSGFYSTSKDDPPAHDNEHPVRLGTTLINDESGWPGRLRGICGNGIRDIAR
jgi:hypothetical protein